MEAEIGPPAVTFSATAENAAKSPSWLPSARFALLIAVACVSTFRCGTDVVSAPPVPAPHRSTPFAAAQTDAVQHDGDAADDPCVWVHPTDPNRSIILGTDKQGGLNAYSLAGRIVQTISENFHPNNVDLLYDFPIAHRRTDLAVASTRAAGREGIKIWSIEPASGRLSELAPGVSISCFGGGASYGLCCYRSPHSGRDYIFVNNKQGQIEQYLLTGIDALGKVQAECVRKLKVSSQTEGCVADHERALFYVGEEEVGIWRFGAEPDDDAPPRLIARVGDEGLTSNVEGLTIYYAAEERGYLIASSQGSNTFYVYDRTDDNKLLAIIDPVASAEIDDVSDTDGIDVVNSPLGDRFPAGLFIAQDGQTPSRRQNFKLYDWRAIAGDALLVDPSWQPRRASTRRH